MSPHASSLAAPDRRMLEHCERLRQLAEAISAGQGGTAIRQQAAAVRLQIESTMFAHHQDEETLLFPAILEAMAGSDAVCLREMAESLTAEHRALESSWREVRHALSQIEAGGLAAAPLSKMIDAFASGYRTHVAREEQELFPLASRLLADDEFAKLEQKFHGLPGN